MQSNNQVNQAFSNTLNDEKDGFKGDGFTFSFGQYIIDPAKYEKMAMESTPKSSNTSLDSTHVPSAPSLTPATMASDKIAFIKNITSIRGDSPEVDSLLSEIAEDLKSKEKPLWHVVHEDSGLETLEHLRHFFTVDKNVNSVPGGRCAHIYRCNLCGKTSRQYVNMKVHLRQHLGLKPFKCSVCKTGFVTSSNCK